jgi:hypothetical protein
VTLMKKTSVCCGGTFNSKGSRNSNIVRVYLRREATEIMGYLNFF